jgi:hypothetical protein
MEKDSFIDTNVIFSYSNYSEQFKEDTAPIVKRCYLYIINKNGKFIICGAVLEEIHDLIIKRARIHKLVINKIQKPEEYSFENNSLISARDVPIAKKLYERFKNENINKVADFFMLERNISELLIQRFLETSIDEKVIPIDQIDNNLVSKIYDIIPNHADSKILASALQLQQEKKEIFIFVTADKKDLDPNGYNFLKDQFAIDFPKEKYRFPELLNLMFVN